MFKTALIPKLNLIFDTLRTWDCFFFMLFNSVLCLMIWSVMCLGNWSKLTIFYFDIYFFILWTTKCVVENLKPCLISQEHNTTDTLFLYFPFQLKCYLYLLGKNDWQALSPSNSQILLFLEAFLCVSTVWPYINICRYWITVYIGIKLFRHK